MITLRETTTWTYSWVPNHTYLVSDDRRKMFGYIPAGKRKAVKFSQPMGFDARGRSFTVVERGPADAAEAPVVAPSARTVTVNGSSGKAYTLTQVGPRWSCSCPGYNFRGRCKHSDSMSGTK